MSAPLVLMLSNAHPPGDVRVVRKEGAALAAAGWRVLHLCPAEGPQPAVGAVGIATFRRRGGFLGRILALPGLCWRARRLRPAVIHAHEPDSWLAALVAGRLGGAKVVLDVHEHYPSRLDSRLPPLVRPLVRGTIRLLCRGMARAADAVVVAKEGLAEDFRGARRLVAVRNYAPLPPLPPRRHGPGPLTLLHLGALSAARGAFVMLDALARAPADTRLLLVGRFTDGAEARFRAEAEARGLAGRILLTGWLPPEEALARAAEADVGLVLFQPGEENHRLALPHKLFDCMALGLPVIVPAFAPQLARIVADAGCGLAVDPTDPEAIVSALVTLADPALRARLGAAGRQAVAQRFCWAAEAARLLGLYGSLLPAAAPAGAPAGPAGPRAEAAPHPSV
jgi:glycosyltransferase involved in cell wall biosynthesis